MPYGFWGSIFQIKQQNYGIDLAKKVLRNFGRIFILTLLILPSKYRGGSDQCSKSFSILRNKLAKLHLKRSVSVMKPPG